MWYNCSIAKANERRVFLAPAPALTTVRSNLTMAIHDYTPEDIERFWSKVAITANPDKCWEWQAGVNKKGYGKFSARNRSQSPLRSNRVVWELTHGKIPDDLWVLHSCDNPSCCNPKHLFLGTASDNTQDMMNKGRNRCGRLRGEQSTVHKLTAEQVAFIRQRYAEGDISQRALARQVGVGQSQIQRILAGKSWRND